jgi:sec-independent protein translocase protein TatB
MPGIGWTELLLVAAIAIVVVGPKDLPILMRTIGRFVGKARALAREFQDSFEEIAREAELEELRTENERLHKMMVGPIGPATPPMGAAAETELREKVNAEVLAAEASAKPVDTAAEMTPLAPGGPATDADNVTPFRGGVRR